MMIYIPSLTQAILLTEVSHFENGLKAFVSLNRDWFEGTEQKSEVSVSEYQVSKTSLY